MAEIYQAIGVKPGRRERHLFLIGLPIGSTFLDCSAHQRSFLLIVRRHCVRTCPPTPHRWCWASLRQGPPWRRKSHLRGGKKKTITHTHTHTHTRTYNVYIYINNPSLEFQPVHLMFIDRLHRDQYPPYSQLERRWWAIISFQVHSPHCYLLLIASSSPSPGLVSFYRLDLTQASQQP